MPKNKTKKTELKYRLYCEACTGIAEYTEEKKKGEVICHNCAKRTPRKAENYILLTKSEQKRLNTLLNE